MAVAITPSPQPYPRAHATTKPMPTNPQLDESNINNLITLCLSTKSLTAANRIRAHLSRIDHVNVFQTNQLINLFSKLGDIESARHVFNHAQHKNSVTWNAMLSGYCRSYQFVDSFLLFSGMVESGYVADEVTYLVALRAAVGTQLLTHGAQVHARVIKNGITCVEVGNAVVNMYAKLGTVDEAEKVADKMRERDVVTWNSLINANCKNGYYERALDFYVEMIRSGLLANEFTFGSLLGIDNVSVVRVLHAHAAKLGLSQSVVTGTALIDAYARFELLAEATCVFESMIDRNIITYNTAIAAYLENGDVHEGVRIFHEMGELGFIPDGYTVSALINASETYLTIKQVHALAVKTGQHKRTATANALIVAYGRTASVTEAVMIFKNIEEHDLVSYNSLMQAYVTNNEFEEALKIFVELKAACFSPDKYSFASAFAAGDDPAIHCDLIKREVVLDSFLGSALIEMYSRLNNVDDIVKVFDEIKVKNSITWNSMISALAEIGGLNEVISHFCSMSEPDEFTYASVLSACAKAAALPQGEQVHGSILKSAKIDTAVSNALITMYSKSGSIDSAETIFDQLTTKNVVSWTSMISAYAATGRHNDAVKLFELMTSSGAKPNANTFVAVLTACSHTGEISKACKYFKKLENPTFDHYACLIDVLCRAGKLSEAERLITEMPYKPNVLVWKMLLSGCRIHMDVERARRAMEMIVSIEPRDSSAYVLMGNLCRDVGDADREMEVRDAMRENAVRKEAGMSWILERDRVHEFVARDVMHPRKDEIYSILTSLIVHMEDLQNL